MAVRQPTEQKNLDIYGDAPIPWSRAEEQLVKVDGPRTWGPRVRTVDRT